MSKEKEIQRYECFYTFPNSGIKSDTGVKNKNGNYVKYADYKKRISKFELEKAELLEFVNEVVNNKDVYGNYNKAVFLSKKYNSQNED
jgi:hypothetical protein